MFDALKALALIRIERFNDAEALINSLEDICRTDEIDEAFVQALSHCYKELNRPDRVVDLYTELTRRQPTNEQFFRELFFSCARVANLREQQRVALQLAKICTTTEPSTYYMWAVLVILVQGFENKQLGVSMSFQLANRMLEKVTDVELVQHQGGLELRLTALETMEKYAEAIKLIEVHFDQSNLNMHIRQRLRRLHNLNGSYEQLFQLCIGAVQNEPNDWSNWVNLTDTFLQLHDKDDRFLSELIQKCQFFEEKNEKKDLVGRRTLLLAKLLLIERLSSANLCTQRNLVEEQFGSPFVLHQEMIRTFHDRPSTFMDLKIFLNLLSAEQQRALLLIISTLSTNGEAAQSADSVWTFLLSEMISFHCFRPSSLTVECLKDSIHRLLNKIPLINGDDELAVAVFVQLVSNYFWELFQRTGDYNLLVMLLSFLEVVNKQPVCNALTPILLCRIYAIFGNALRINELIGQMQIKFVQRINFAFLQCFVAENFGLFKTAENYYSSMVNLHKSNEREISDCIVSAFRKEKYLQIINLYEFSNACRNSVYSMCADVQNALFTGCFSSNSLEMASNCFTVDDDFDLGRLVDNREFSAVKVFLSDSMLREIREESLKEIRAYLGLRSSLGNAICSIGKQTLERNAKAFFATLEQCQKEFSTAPNIRNLLENFTDTGLELFLRSSNTGTSGPVQLPVLVIEAAIRLTTDSDHNNEPVQQQQQSEMTASNCRRLTEAAEQFTTFLDGFVAADNQSAPITSLKEQIDALKNVSKLVEMLAFALIGGKRLEQLFLSTKCNGKKERSDSGKKREKPHHPRQQQQPQHHVELERKSVDLDSLGPYSQAIHRALQCIRTFVSTKLKRVDAPLSSVQDDDQFGLRELFPKHLKSELEGAEKKVLETVSSPDLFNEITEKIDHLINFSCL
uniref:N-terminal acetyltransferase B complex subunit MDM20 homolog n=1 Tax=Globodera pallida TaxID=36090 RepID=A0A183C8X6_GLOPA